MSNDLGEVRFAKLEDMPYIVSLSKKESISLGFIPKLLLQESNLVTDGVMFAMTNYL